jgi:hypothetical protein
MAFGIFDKVAEFDLPHPPVPLAILLVVERAICAAWEFVLTHHRPEFDPTTATENEITHELHEAIYDRVFNSGAVDGFNKHVFTTVGRDSKVRSYNFSSLDKMPDLVIQLVNRPSGIMNTQDGIFIECKPVDASHPVPKVYCDKGIMRFVSGEYAWAMTSALMVGYAKKHFTILPLLTEALKTRTTTITTIQFPHLCSSSAPGSRNETVHISVHERPFIYLENEKNAEPITIRHLWLSRD